MVEATRQLDSASSSPRGCVEEALSILVNRVFEEPDVGLFFSTATLEEGERLDYLIEHLVKPYHDAFVPLLQSAMDAGQLSCNDPEVVFWILVSGISRTVSYHCVVEHLSPVANDPQHFHAAVLQAALSMLN